MTFAYLCIGLIAGVLSGLLGIGGGTFIIPVFVIFLGMSQHAAQGTALASILLPVYILATMRYYQEGHINISIAAVVAAGIMVGALIGAHFAQAIPGENLKKMFGIYLIVVGVKLVFFK